MSVNLSARELAEPDLVARVAQVLEETGLEPRFLTLELTETALMVDPVQATAKLRTLNALGVGLALDDFGTGFSSLSHLRRFPVDTLKIDKSFVDDVAVDADGFDFVHAIVRLARTMHLTTVAEGVEEPGQLRNLGRAGCDLMQGNLLTRPLPAAEIETILYGTSPRQPVQVALTPGR